MSMHLTTHDGLVAATDSMVRPNNHDKEMLDALASIMSERASAQAGAALAEDCLNAMPAAKDQTESANLLAAVLVDLASLKHPKSAAAGFASVLVATLELGLGVNL